MATYRLTPPAPFPFKSPDEWPQWKKHFEQFRTASGLAAEQDRKQVNTLLYTMGEAEDTLASTIPTADERNTYRGVIGKFDAFFQVRRNVIFERARFNRCQNEDELVEQFITSLYSLAERCDYGALREAMIRDRIVVGIKDKKLSAYLQMDADLTLEVAKRKVRQREAVAGQQDVVQDKTAIKHPVEGVHTKKTYRRKQQYKAAPSRSSSQSGTTTSGEKCSRCGRAKHSRQDCPAREVVYHSCKKRGHFSAQCFSRKPRQQTSAAAGIEVIDSNDDVDAVFLNTIVGSLGDDDCWLSKILVDKKEIIFKIDTGAEVTVISEDVLSLIGKRNELRETSRVLCGPDKRVLPVVGQVTVQLEYKEYSIVQTVYVLKRIQRSLLGLPAIKALHLLTQVNQVEPMVMEQYPSLFTGLGTFKCSYEIKLKPDAQPHAVFTARTVSLPLRKKVKEELDCMESLGVIS